MKLMKYLFFAIILIFSSFSFGRSYINEKLRVPQAPTYEDLEFPVPEGDPLEMRLSFLLYSTESRRFRVNDWIYCFKEFDKTDDLIDHLELRLYNEQGGAFNKNKAQLG